MNLLDFVDRINNNVPTESRGSLLPMEGKKDPLLKVVTTELAVVTAVTSKRRLARFWAFSAALDIGSFSAKSKKYKF